MAFGALNRDHGTAPLAEINMIPLIDVMLVLLVIFIVTAPLLTHAVRVELPKAASRPAAARPDAVQLAVRADGEVAWNGERIDASRLDARLAAVATQTPQPELRLAADRTVQYQRVADVMAAAARAGVTRLAFVTDPRATP